MRYSDLKYLTVELPEDVERLKWFGDFERALRVIDLRLEKELPLALRRRLELEKEVLRRLPETYIYGEEQALDILRENIEGFEDWELERLRDEDALDWIYVYGKVRFKDNFLSNLIKTRAAYAKRVKNKELLADGIANVKLLQQTIREMKDQGKVACRIHIKASLSIRKEAERPGEMVRVHLPLPVEYAQVRNFRLIGTSPEAVLISRPDALQRTVCFEAVLKANQEFTVEYEFENHMDYMKLDGDKVSDVQPVFYTEEQLPHISFTPYMKELVSDVIGEEQNPLQKARSIYDYITMHVMYSFVRPYTAITDIPGYTAVGLKGDCGLQALLFITMCRCAGIPARWQAGLYATPLEIGCHDWAQFYVAPYGWLYADCSFGGSAYRAGDKERWDFYFGNLEPFRVPMAAEFQQEFYPAKCFMRNDPYDNQTGEVEYADCGLISKDYITEQQILEIEPV